MQLKLIALTHAILYKIFTKSTIQFDTGFGMN